MSEVLTEEAARDVARGVLEACWVAHQMARFEGGGDPWLMRAVHRLTGGALSAWVRDGTARIDVRGLQVLEMDDAGAIWLEGAQEPQPREAGELALVVALVTASAAQVAAGDLCDLLRRYADGEGSARGAIEAALAQVTRRTPGAVTLARLASGAGACLTVCVTHDGRPLRVTYQRDPGRYLCAYGVDGPSGQEWERYCAPARDSAVAQGLLHGALTHLALLTLLGDVEEEP